MVSLKIPSLHSTNNALTVMVLCLGFYIFITPFVPALSLWWQDMFGDDGYHYSGQLSATAGADGSQEAPKDNRLVLPSIHIDEPIVVGDDPQNIHKGVWHRPNTSTPEKGSNTVLVGHRWDYGQSSSVFYNLDKVVVGDLFAIWWEGKEYVYRVTENKIVEPSAIEVEDPTDKPIATLYTCTPIWTAKQRLVVVAELVEKEEAQ